MSAGKLSPWLNPEDEAALFHYVDEGWSGEGWKPSEVLVIGFSILRTGRHPDEARNWLETMIADARERWRQGFLANPFTREPVPRSPQ